MPTYKNPLPEQAQNPPPATNVVPMLPWVQLPQEGRYVSEFATETAFILRNKDVFWRFDKCVVPKQNEEGKILLGELKPAEFSTLIEHYIHPWRWRINKRGNAFKSISTLSREDAAMTLVCRDFLETLRPLKAFNQVSLPAFYDKNEIRLLPLGYCARHQIYTARNAISYPCDMTLTEAQKFFEDLLGEFCFVEGDSERAKSVVIASILTLFTRHLLPEQSIRPNFLASANSEGSGKTLLWHIPMISLQGCAPAGTMPEDEAEMRKMIYSVALSGSSILFLDNLKGFLNSPSLEALTTSPYSQFRILGTNTLAEVLHGITVFITSNRGTFSPDMRRRTLTVELFLDDVQPENREIKRPLDDAKLLELRPRILGSLWALVNNWQSSGFKKPAHFNQSFLPWSIIVGGIMEAAGYISPVAASGGTLFSGDRDMVDMMSLTDQMHLRQEYKISELVELAFNHHLFEHIIGDEPPANYALEPKERSRFGLLLKRFQDRRFPSGACFRCDDTKQRKTYTMQ